VSDPLLDAIEQILRNALTDILPGVIDRLVEVGGPRAYSVTNVAERIAVSESTVRRHIKAGHLQTVPHLSPERVSAAALEEFLAGPDELRSRRAS
jgi:hypothetical protein